MPNDLDADQKKFSEGGMSTVASNEKGPALTTSLRLLRLGCVLVAALTVGPARGAADDDPGFCPAIQEVLQASRTDFNRWRGTSRGSATSSYDAERTLPRASDCRIEREPGETRYTCDWEYREDEEASARAAAARFLDGILDCLGVKVQQVHPYKESEAGRRQMTRVIVEDGAASYAELRVSSGLSSSGSAWYVEFSANRSKENR